MTITGSNNHFGAGVIEKYSYFTCDICLPTSLDLRLLHVILSQLKASAADG